LELDGEADELRVLLDDILESLFLEVFEVVNLEMEDDLGTSGEFIRILIVLNNSESTTSSGLPFPLLVIIIRLGDDGELISNQESRVETHTELTNHGDISSRRESLHESLGTRLGDGTEVVDKFLLGHTNTGIPDSEGVVGLVGDDSDTEVGFTFDTVASDGLVADLVESIRRVGDEFSEEDFLVGVEGVDDETHQLLDISTESEGVLGHDVRYCL